MKITKLNENQELADLYKQSYKDSGKELPQELYDRAVKYNDNDSNRIIRNNEKLLKLKNDPRTEEEKERDKYNDDTSTEDSSNSITLREVKSQFDDPKFDANIGFRTEALKNLSDVYTKMGLKTAGDTIFKYSPKFIKSWANSFNWQAVGDRNEPFVQALNNPSLDAILNGDEFRWVKLYNILYDADDNYSKYAAEPNTLLCNGNLYKSDIDNQEARKLIEIDFKDNGVHRDGFNKRMDRNAWSEIISDAKKLGVEVKDNSSDKLIKAIKNKEKELSSEEKIAAVKALNFKKDELRELSNKLENANNS